MIIIKVMGGLGNQMFQYSLAKALECRGKEVKLDISYYDNIPQGDTIRKFELDRFFCNIGKATYKEIAQYTNPIRKLIDAFGEHTKLYEPTCLVESVYSFNPKIFNIDNGYLIGYWQTEKYFKDVRDVLLHEFRFDKMNMTIRNIKLQEEILNSENTVSIHVRAGDYLNQYNRENFGDICTNDYYNNACKYCVDKLGQVKFYLFTNDADWVRNNIKLDEYNYTIVDWNSEEDGWIDMYFMSICQNNIIANSSFSWWGAWLNTNPEKIVISPRKWENNVVVQDIIPEEWIRI